MKPFLQQISQYCPQLCRRRIDNIRAAILTLHLFIRYSNPLSERLSGTVRSRFCTDLPNTPLCSLRFFSWTHSSADQSAPCVPRWANIVSPVWGATDVMVPTVHGAAYEMRA